MIKVEESDGHVVLRLPAEFNFKIYTEFGEIYQRFPPGTSYKIDFDSVVSMDSAALGMLLLMRSCCGDERADICLTNCNARIRNLLDIAFFNKYFRIE